MGTRSLICVFYRGRFVIAQYSQWDGYPEGQGMTILNFLLNSQNIERLKNGLQYLVVLDDDEVREYEERSAPRSTCKCCEKGMTDIPPLPASLSRDTGARILEIVANATSEDRVPVWLNLEFANNALFCEWAYVVDLDKGEFEVYSGGTYKTQAHNNRFIDVGGEKDTVPILVKSFPFTELPTTEDTFVSTLNEVIDNELIWEEDDD